MNSRQLAQQWPFPRHKNYVKQLRIAASQWFRSKGHPTHPKMDYCLSEWNNWPQNIILEEVVNYIQKFKSECERNKKPFPLHKYVHHGLSSQAMAFNLLGPLITRKDYSPLIHVLQSKNVQIASNISVAEFEFDDRSIFNEDAGQPTSIDIVLKDSAGKPSIFMESKLVEQEFGGCSVFAEGDCEGMNPINHNEVCYLNHIGRRYWELMGKYGISRNLTEEKQCIFVAHYQFFREVLFSLEKGGIFALLSDERSPVYHCKAKGIYRGIMPFLTGFIPDELKNRIVSISIQELISQIGSNPLHSDWVNEFKMKYDLAL